MDEISQERKLDVALSLLIVKILEKYPKGSLIDFQNLFNYINEKFVDQ
jgi:hypothetical protein